MFLNFILSSFIPFTFLSFSLRCHLLLGFLSLFASFLSKGPFFKLQRFFSIRKKREIVSQLAAPLVACLESSYSLSLSYSHTRLHTRTHARRHARTHAHIHSLTRSINVFLTLQHLQFSLRPSSPFPTSNIHLFLSPPSTSLSFSASQTSNNFQFRLKRLVMTFLHRFIFMFIWFLSFELFFLPMFG